MVAEIFRVVITGPPGVGKTTLILRLLKAAPLTRVVGFYTQEFRQDRTRVGFEAVGLSTVRKVVLASTQCRTGLRVGKYGVDVQGFEQFLSQEFSSHWQTAQLLVVDEIGKMECLSARFVELMKAILASDRSLLATCAQRASGFPAQVRQRTALELITLSRATMESVYSDLLQRLQRLA
jgi:nucleoside-triphosphatase